MSKTMMNILAFVVVDKQSEPILNWAGTTTWAIFILETDLGRFDNRHIVSWLICFVDSARKKNRWAP
jgi:hypothetical protein